jgi:methylated-DNA-[protein]-cysteine S-methyltransferase
METTYLTTDFGTFQLTAGPLGLKTVSLWNKDVPDQKTEPANEFLRVARRQLKEYFRGERQDFDVKLDWSEATNFYRNVWQKLTEIPYGRTTSYQFIAERLGDKNAIRAVGQANGRNPIAIIVPCHRVIAKNGDLQGYFYGLDFKRKLLALENPKSFGEQGSLF